MPAISVIVPVCDVAGYVGPCLASLLSETETDFDAIVVDDGSTDDSLAEVQAAAGDDPRVTVLTRPNGGLSAARNTGLEAASGDYIAFLDSDDRLAPDFLERLRGAVERTGCAWAACAVMLCREGGEDRPHPAIHGATHPAADGVEVMKLDTWPRVVRFWPSAWNKLYRRSLIADMRFAEGLHYEDHPWFHEAAARTDAIAYVPEPLYLQTQGRAGQITADGSDRVFEQFEILERVEDVYRTADKPDPDEGLARLATRLIFERTGAISDPVRRARFLSAARDWLDARDLSYTPDWDRETARSLALTMAGEPPVTVVIPTDIGGDPLERTLASLARQRLQDFETLIVQDGVDETVRQDLLARAAHLPGASVLASGGPGPSAARNRGLDAARGRFVLFLDAGDTLFPATLWLWVEGMLRQNADIGLSPFRIGGPKGKLHGGCHDGLDPWGDPLPESPPTDLLAQIGAPARPLPSERAIRLHSLPSARIYRRSLLTEHGLDFPPEPLAAWHFTIAAALAAHRAVHFPWGGVVQSTAADSRRLWRAAVSPEDLRAAVEQMSPLLDGTAHDWRIALYARAVWEKANYAELGDAAARSAWMEQAARAAPEPQDPADLASIDSFVGPRIRGLFRTDAP